MGEPSTSHPLDIEFVSGRRVVFQEKRRYEFKSVGAEHAVNTIANHADEYAVAFLNEGSGGRILWGIENDGGVTGVALDRQKCDEVRRVIEDKLATVQPSVSPSGFQVELHYVWQEEDGGSQHILNDRYVVELLVKPPHPSRLYTTAGGTVHVKTDAGKRKLVGDQVADFVRNRIPASFQASRAWLEYFQQEDGRTKRYQELQGYQELRTKEGSDLETAVDAFLDSHDRLMVLYGDAGSGKTAALCRLVGRLSRDWTQTLEANPDTLSIDELGGWLSVFFSLRGTRIASLGSLADILIGHVQEEGNFWDGSPIEALALLRDRRFKWLLCLDGYDEIGNPEARGVFIAVLRELAELLSGKVILSTRPIAEGIETQGWAATAAHIAPLTEDQVYNYLAQNIDERFKENLELICESFKTNPDFWKMLSYPLYLEAALLELAEVNLPEFDLVPPVPEGAGMMPDAGGLESPFDSKPAPVTSISESDLILSAPIEERLPSETRLEESLPLQIDVVRLLDLVYRRLRKREEKRGLLAGHVAEDRWMRTGRLALAMDGKHERCGYGFALRRLGSEQALAWVLGLGILVEEPGRAPFGFFSQLTKLYFASDLLCCLLNDGAHREVRRRLSRTEPDFRKTLQPMLSRFVAGDSSRLFEDGGQDG
jgi:hypothetical protein